MPASIWAGVRRALDCFSDPRVLDACSTGTNFAIKDLLEAKGTAYFVGAASAQLSVAPLIAALVEAIADEARQPAGRGNLTVPLSLILDEAANIAPLPTLPNLLSEGGGSGIQTLVVLQSLAQGRHRWSEAEMDAMWDASTIKLDIARYVTCWRPRGHFQALWGN
ncbi:MAG: type IV secretory system conjugative DNA transfer family protein [Actinobacteria bacterium]|nr:type IV secretory system conjugative DNA transfer family protein [Actinomycetota bacterium]